MSPNIVWQIRNVLEAVIDHSLQRHHILHIVIPELQLVVFPYANHWHNKHGNYVVNVVAGEVNGEVVEKISTFVFNLNLQERHKFLKVYRHIAEIADWKLSKIADLLKEEVSREAFFYFLVDFVFTVQHLDEWSYLRVLFEGAPDHIKTLDKWFPDHLRAFSKDLSNQK